ncbi:ribonuclease H-like YkuK family protein [Paenibacillus sp. IB182496]|uniref:Ribonuclease H-like YkuK family protein n=1 Tax=Paenibacillus sabuli TaxID=2772509 RepID=A0A927BRI0_9BACL|nr:ribonuclease H-like YkuK family protein [Paenibacillus sabuli]MBD2844360.1 ribonuclease H-like YkuK family protein [Paenibacillus sabuli]
MNFVSPTQGNLSMEQVVTELHQYVKQAPDNQYKLVIGTDSHTTRTYTMMVSVILVHRIGQGARFFYRKTRNRPLMDLRQRIYRETELSLELVDALNKRGLNALTEKLPLEIHIDIGQQGDTKVLINEIMGWVTSVGYEARIKPLSYGASSVADRFAE